MATFDLTPKHKIVPSLAFWGKSTPVLPISEQNILNIESLRALEHHYRIRIRLDSINVAGTKWNTDLLQQIAAASYPLNELLAQDTTIKISKEWLTFWEIYSVGLLPSLITRMKNRVEGAKTRSRARAQERKEEYTEKEVKLRGVPVRTFHVQDNHSSTISTMQKVINKVEYETSVQINWEWLATHTPKVTEDDIKEISKNREKWVRGADGDGSITVPNMRAWKNKIATSLKVADVIVINVDNEDDSVNGIAFSLMNLGASGSAIVSIPRIASASTASMIHLFSHCFERTELNHSVAEDRMFLCGDGFLDNLTAKHHKLLYEFCELDPGHSNQSPFTSEYLKSDEFLATLDALIQINSAIQSWRYEYYEKILLINAQLVKSASMRTFDKYIESFLADNFKDDSKKWISATGFNFFTQ